MTQTQTRPPEGCAAAHADSTATDAAIDRLVYDLYGLTDKEIRLVEDATQT